MMNDIFKAIDEFNEQTHGSSDYYKETVFVLGEKEGEFAPLKYLVKKAPEACKKPEMLRAGFVYQAFDLFGGEKFNPWFEKQFSRKLKRGHSKTITILHLPNNKAILDAVEMVNKCYEILRDQQIILNGKKLPVQLGEWYAKCIFGLEQRKSASQRGFDFYIDDKRAEVKIHWGDHSSPKGVKVRKSLVDLADYCIIIYVGKNFMIREVCFLDSEFVMRKFSGKGHTIFLKDADISQYFFSNSEKHIDKVTNSSALLKYSSPVLAMKLHESFSS